MDREAALGEWRRGWKLPLVSALAYGAGVYYLYALGLFVDPLQKELGWTRSEITFGLTILSVISVVLVPIIGWFVDRNGPRRVAIYGMLFYCAAFASLGLAGSSVWNWWLLWVLVGLGSACVQGVVWTTAVVSRFDASRGIAIAVTLCGSGIGSTTAPLLANATIDLVGWRTAFPLMGLILAVCVMPGLLLFFYGANDRRDRKQHRPAKSGKTENFIALREAFKSPNFIKLLIASSLIVMSVTSLLVHFVPIVVDAGGSRDVAAGAAALIGAGSIVGRLIAGWLLDRIHGARIGSFVFSLPIIVTLSLISSVHDGAALYITAFVLGLSLGSEIDVIGYLTSRYLGTANFGSMFGVITGLQVLSLGIGPPLLGLTYDLLGSYDGVLWLLIPFFAVASLLIATLGPYPGAHEESLAPA